MKYNAAEFRKLAASVTGAPDELRNRPASMLEFQLSNRR
jgi:hypothetical protein